MANSHGIEALMERFIAANKEILKNAFVRGGKSIAIPTQFTGRKERNELLSEIFSQLPKKKDGFTLNLDTTEPAHRIKASSASSPFYIGTLNKSHSATTSSSGDTKSTTAKDQQCDKPLPSYITGLTDVFLSPDRAFILSKSFCEKCKRSDLVNLLNAFYSPIKQLNSTSQELYTQVSEYKLDENKKLPSEMFEVFSSIVLAKHIASAGNNSTHPLRKLFKIPPKLKWTPDKVSLYIPKKANTPLVDFYIDIAGTKDKKTSLRISVKSLVSSAQSNTIGLAGMFVENAALNGNGKADPQKFKTYADGKGKNKNETQVARAAILNPGKDQGTDMMYSIVAAVFLKDVNYDLAAAGKKALKNAGSDATTIINQVIKVFRQFSTNGVVKNQVRQYRSADLSKNLETWKTSGLFGNLAEQNIETLKKFMDASYASMTMKSGPPSPKYTLDIARYCMERVLHEASQKELGQAKGLNFYEMFYFNVLVRLGVGYAVTVKTPSGKKGVYNLQMKFLTSKNFTTFASWMELRSKNSAGAPSAQALGADFVH